MENKKELSDVSGYIYHYESFGTVDGPGTRIVFFLQGCPLSCLYCHNPDSTAFNKGELWTAGDTAKYILRYKNFIKKGGATISGGEPLAQPEFVYAVFSLLKENGIHTALDTSGAVALTDKTRAAVDISDMLLLDIKSMNSDVSKALTGKDNTLSLQWLDYCESINKPVWIRHVLVDGYTLNEEDLTALAKHLKKYKCVERLELLPFHKLGETKWEACGREYKLYDTPATTKEQVQWAQQFFIKEGLKIHG